MPILGGTCSDLTRTEVCRVEDGLMGAPHIGLLLGAYSMTHACDGSSVETAWVPRVYLQFIGQQLGGVL